MDFNKAMPWAGMRRCILNQDGTVEGYLDPNNSDKWEDGSDVDWAAVEANVQNCMVEIPKFYYCKKVISDPKEERIFGVADKPVKTKKIGRDEWEVHPAFFRERTKLCDDQSGVAVEVDYRYAPAFKGWKDSSNRLRSLPGKQPTANITIGTARNYAKAMGNGWSQFDYYLLYALQMLYITEYGNPDSQAAIGRGYVDGNSAAIITGATRQYGNHSYGETTGKKQMSYRGVEDFWGNIRYWIDGFYYNSSRNMLIGKKGFNDSGRGYENCGSGGSASIGGSTIRDIQPGVQAGFVIKGTAGGIPDFGGLYAAGELPYAGGYWADADYAGAFFFYVYYGASNAYSYIAAALCF